MEIASGLNGRMLSRMLNRNTAELAQSVKRLSSGKRINQARDDAAGLAISESLTAQIRGLQMGQRNINDAISMLQVADSALSEVTNNLQRMRELSVRAANTGSVSSSNRRILQREVNELALAIKDTIKTTEFNGIKLLAPLYEGRVTTSSTLDRGSDTNADLRYALQASWMSQAESAISTWYGLNASGDLNVLFDDTASIGSEGAVLTRTNYNASTGLYDDLTLTIDVDEFAGASLPNGGTGPMYYDRIIARELTKAYIAREVNTNDAAGGVPEWFIEGAAELLVGGDERLDNDGDIWMVLGEDITNWTNTSAEKSHAYLAVRYINDVLINNGSSMVDLFGELKSKASAPGSQYLYKAINDVAGLTGPQRFNNEADFMGDFFFYALFNYSFLDLTNGNDVGAIGGAEANGINARGDVSAEGVITDTDVYQSNPTGFNMLFPATPMTTGFESVNRSQGLLHYDFRFGGERNQNIRVNLEQFSIKSLAINNLNLVKYAQQAIVTLDSAIERIIHTRASYGAQMNALEHTIRSLETASISQSSARSQITDADYAKELAEYTKSLMLQNSASALLAQANGDNSLVMDLLDGSKIINSGN